MVVPVTPWVTPPRGRPVDVFLDDHRLGRIDWRLRLWGWPDRRNLHRGYHLFAHALIAQRYDVVGLQRGRHAVAADVVDDELFINSCAGHGDDVVDCYRPTR